VASLLEYVDCTLHSESVFYPFRGEAAPHNQNISSAYDVYPSPFYFELPPRFGDADILLTLALQAESNTYITP
jgi:hypothetical protein